MAEANSKQPAPDKPAVIEAEHGDGMFIAREPGTSIVTWSRSDGKPFKLKVVTH
jgi:hypothetical protein